MQEGVFARIGLGLAVLGLGVLGPDLLGIDRGLHAESVVAPAPNKLGRATAFFYGPKPPRELLHHYDRLVVDPDHVPSPEAFVAPIALGASAASPRAVKPAPRAQLFAYVSIGEVHPSRPWRKEVPPKLVLGKNGAWGSEFVDVGNPAWAALLLDKVFEPLWKAGYRGFFLDTLDSHLVVAKDEPARVRARAGIAALIAEVKKRHPDARLLANRGFELLDAIAPHLEGLVVESLFETHTGAGKGYAPVAPTETAALRARIDAARTKHGLPVVVIDYVDPRDKPLRRAAAKRIADAGYEPWIATPTLDDVGVGRVEIVSRKVLILYKSLDDGEYLGVHDACVLIGPILEWYGFVPEYFDTREGLPPGNLAGRYAGIVSFVPDGIANEAGYRKWILDQMNVGLRVAFFYNFGFDPDGGFLGKLGLASAKSDKAKAPVKFTAETDMVGFETKAKPRVRDLPPVRVKDPTTTSFLRLEDSAHVVWDGVVVGPWGGAAFYPYVLDEGLEGARKWVLDPFKFLERALALPKIPAPDVTTESGRRIWTNHIDGDAAVSKAELAGNPYTAQVLLQRVLVKHRVPHTVSVVEGETGPTGKYPKDSPKVEPWAREIFKLPYVELASHTFSHPFFWEDAEAGKTAPHGVEPVHLEVPGYKFDLTREIKGSIDYINEKLAPPGKKVKVLLWSGSCSPSAKAVKLTHDLGVFNVNGGGATRSFDTSSLTRGSAMGIPKAEGVYQVFAPVENENVYTNDFLGPFYGYRRAIETFQLMESPRRLQHITIYYHFYSAAKLAALVALEEVYHWAESQETTPLYLSEYAVKAFAFQEMSLGRRVDDDAWEIGNAGELRTLRLHRDLGYPDFDKSVGVAGVRDVPQGRYVTLARDAETPLLFTSPSQPTGLRLVEANAHTITFLRSGKGAKVRLSGHVPLRFSVAGATSCTLTSGKDKWTGKPDKDRLRFELDRTDTGEATLACP